MRRNIRINNCILLFIAALISIGHPPPLADGSPLGFPPLPFIRGGSSTTATKTRTASTKQKQQRQRRRQRTSSGPLSGPIKLIVNVKQGLDKIGNNFQNDWKNFSKGMQTAQTNIGNFIVNIPRALPFVPPRKRSLKCSKLDEVCKTFSSCLKGTEVDTAQLIKACRAHLIFMKSGGNSLRLVAKDLESNLQKAERPFKKLPPKQGKTLSSLLESESQSGIHHGNILKEQSAAMGLLWIRRSLAFQLELYSSFLTKDGPHPRDAAYAAYSKHLYPFHGWALRKVFPASLSQMPERQAFIAKFGGVSLEELNEEYDREIVKKLKSLVAVWDPLISTWEKDFERLDLEDTRKV
mmetsp:Transcript_18642/g.26540  ORF Transcript_18642/g.26540 Transcript_18642/m.26540 type:complete len:351 (+) Transcript_18642:196-1248(+)|eukprot:CAMPEP_0201693986 /NCGR_PEP_ID=MMETSP0578-20130828/6399_1 /ASSEMBLY_ACC=CAM_ASM_000663 /TAXON_ID=267565 /ORGANISM="Skeletonema grethea, Strain CCMP 1804" /LENGTH=350 /DNA_ID=CAMNT_0048179605 /DNA_START=168 /DNA_END=1220 /DNA_ORIENTATION=-